MYIFIDPSMFYLVFSTMLLSFALGHFSSFDDITRPLNFSIKKWQMTGGHMTHATTLVGYLELCCFD